MRWLSAHDHGADSPAEPAYRSRGPFELAAGTGDPGAFETGRDAVSVVERSAANGDGVRQHRRVDSPAPGGSRGPGLRSEIAARCAPRRTVAASSALGRRWSSPRSPRSSPTRPATRARTTITAGRHGRHGGRGAEDRPRARAPARTAAAPTVASSRRRRAPDAAAAPAGVRTDVLHRARAGGADDRRDRRDRRRANAAAVGAARAVRLEQQRCSNSTTRRPGGATPIRGRAHKPRA